MSKETITYTHSEIATFLTCPRKYDYSYRDRLELKRVHFPFIAGQSWHDGITSLYRFKDIDRAISDALTSLKNARERILKNHFIQEKDEIDFSRYETILEASILRYFTVYSKIISKFEVLHFDDSIKAKLCDNIYISGHPDLILKQLKTKKIYVYELKSSSNITKEMIDKYYYDFQTSFYFLLVSDVYNASGIYFDVIKKPTIRLGAKETESSFLVRLQKFYEDLSEDELFYQDSYTRNTQQLEETVNVIKYAIYNIDRLNKFEKIIYPMNRMRCYDFSSSCEYLPLCNYGKTDLTLKSYKQKENNR